MRHCSVLLLLGSSLIGLILFAPIKSAGNQDGIGLLQVASATIKGEQPDAVAVRCGLKIIFLSVGLFLVIESVATVLAVLKRKHIALAVYCLHCVPCLGALLGGFCLVRALF